MKRIEIVDTTLRDGLQAPGIDFSRAEKIEIAGRLDRIGVAELELGTPAMGQAVCDDIRTIAGRNLNARTSAWCRARHDDLALAGQCGVDGVHISFPVSDILLAAFSKDLAWVYRTLSEILPEAVRQFQWVSVGAQDASRTEMKRLIEFARAAAGFRIDRLRLADTVGIWRPSRIDRAIRIIKRHVPKISLEFHAHNDLGMATANAVAAAEAGADAVSVTVNGIGERAGNAALEEVVMAMSGSPGMEGGGMECGVKTEDLIAVCDRVAAMSGRPIPVSKPITGSAVFSHESGIHCAALLKSPLAYQPFLPQAVGRSDTRFIIGSHSGTAALRSALGRHEIELDEDLAPAFLERIRARAKTQKQAISDFQVCRLYIDLACKNRFP